MSGLFSGLKSAFSRSGNRPTVSIQRFFTETEDFRGLSYEKIISLAEAKANKTRPRQDGGTARTWSEDNYAITLLFDANGICLGVEEERV